MRAKFIIFLSVFIGVVTNINAQSCCSGGVPTSSNIGLSPNTKGQLVLAVGADLNFLSTLKSGSTKLEDDLRQRTTQSYLIRAAFSPVEKLSFEVLLPYVVQTREIITNGGDADNQATNGIGDASILATYTLLDEDLSWRVGLGGSIPLGDFDQRDDRGLFLLEDLQPGSGAFDIIFYNSLSLHLSANNPNKLISLRAIYTRNGLNEKSRNGNQTYQFGDDLQILLEYSDQLLVGSQLLSPYAGVRYRNASRDRVDDLPNSGSGGRFLFARGGVNWNISANHGIYVGGEVPLLSHVNETQLAPSFSLNFGWTTNINTKKSNNILIIN